MLIQLFDRWKIISGGLDEGVTTAQSDITSGLAYNDGFRKAYKVQMVINQVELDQVII